MSSQLKIIRKGSGEEQLGYNLYYHMAKLCFKAVFDLTGKVHYMKLNSLQIHYYFTCLTLL